MTKIDIEQLRAEYKQEEEKFSEEIFGPPRTDGKIACSTGEVYDSWEDVYKAADARHVAWVKKEGYDFQLFSHAPTLEAKFEQLRRAYRINAGLEIGTPCYLGRDLACMWMALSNLLPGDQHTNFYYADPVLNERASQQVHDNYLIQKHIKKLGQEN